MGRAVGIEDGAGLPCLRVVGCHGSRDPSREEQWSVYLRASLRVGQVRGVLRNEPGWELLRGHL